VAYGHRDAAGFIKLNALRLRTFGQRSASRHTRRLLPPDRACPGMIRLREHCAHSNEMAGTSPAMTWRGRALPRVAMANELSRPAFYQPMRRRAIMPSRPPIIPNRTCVVKTLWNLAATV
jgi:hypothetical protein